MSDDEIDRMDVARHLLPPPGDAVAGQLIAEVRRLRLTDAEREAAEWFAEVPKPLSRLTKSNRREQYIAALRGLLDRLGDK